jgi:hypothetical protein
MFLLMHALARAREGVSVRSDEVLRLAAEEIGTPTQLLYCLSGV